MAQKRVAVPITEPMLAFLSSSQFAGLSLSDAIRAVIISHPSFVKIATAPVKPTVEPKTITTVVADTPPAEPVDVHGYLSRTARYREPTLQETMAELDRVSDADTPIGQYRASDVKPRPPCEHGVTDDSFCEACADLELARERMGDGT